MVIPPELVAKLSDCAKTDFTSARDLWFSRQWWFSALVITGLALEGPELWYEMVSIARSRIPRFRYILRENRVELAKVAAFVGWIFIIAGLVGELRAGSKVADLSASIQGCSDAKVREATLQAGNAAMSAQIAEDASKAAKKESSDAFTIAKGARLEADSLKKDIVSAKTLAADAESHLADALQRAANATMELAEYRAKKADRRITSEQQKSIASQLSFPGQPVDLMWYAGSFEGGVFANDIFNALNLNKMARWDVVTHPHTPGEGTIPPNPEPAVSGLVIFTMPTDRSEKAGKQLHDALIQAGVPATLASITLWWPWYAKPFNRDSLARNDARLVIMVGNHP